MGLYEEAIIIDLTTLTQHPQFTRRRRRSFRTIPRNMSKVVSGKAVTSPSFERDQAPVGLHKTQLCAKERAEELLATLDPVFPSFVKAMTRSYVTKCWMAPPREFRRLHLPKQDAILNLVDENQEEYLTKYNGRIGQLGGGWSNFCKAHKLVEGDHLVFQLVKNTTFQVYILRPYALEAIDLTVNLCPKHDKSIRSCEKTESKSRKTASLAILEFPTVDSITDSEKVVSVQVETSSSFEQEQALLGLDNAMLCAKERAEELLTNLDPVFPSFVKAMTRSYATNDWMELPEEFCRLHLPKQDVMFTLIDENHEECLTKYVCRMGNFAISDGWSGFSKSHKLVEGDHLVFQLVKNTSFLIYIIRAYGLGALAPTLSYPKLATIRKSIRTCENTQGNHRKMASLAVLQHPTVESGSDSVKVSSVVPEAVSFLDTTLDFKDVKNLESVTISVNGLIINSEFSKNTQRKYYELCRSQGASLHKNLPEGIDMKFAVDAIAETVTVADAIKSCNLSNSRDDFSAWDKSLGVLEQLGMNVGFLRARLEQLLRVAIESEEAANCYNEALYKRAHAEEEIMRAVRAKLSQLDTMIESLEKMARWNEMMFQEVVDSPW